MNQFANLLRIAALSISVFAATACGGDGDASTTATPTARTTTAAARSTVASPDATPPEGTPTAGTSTAGATPATQVAGGAAPPSTAAPASTGAAAPGRTYSQADAQTLTQAASVRLSDVPAGWSVMTDTTSDNATAAAADPRAGGSFARCGRLLGRLVTMQPPSDQLVTRYLGGQPVSFFTTVTVYATAAGAIDCAIEAATRFAEPGELARQFSTIFIDTAAVVVTTVPYPAVADGSFAATLSGKISAAGTEVNLTILIVAFRKGNVTAVVGSAAASAPATAELTPLVNRVIQSITSAQ